MASTNLRTAQDAASLEQLRKLILEQAVILHPTVFAPPKLVQCRNEHDQVQVVLVALSPATASNGTVARMGRVLRKGNWKHAEIEAMCELLETMQHDAGQMFAYIGEGEAFSIVENSVGGERAPRSYETESSEQDSAYTSSTADSKASLVAMNGSADGNRHQTPNIEELLNRQRGQQLQYLLRQNYRFYNKKCNNCDEMGHIAAQCPQPKDWTRITCYHCHQKGHAWQACQEPVSDSDEGLVTNLITGLPGTFPE